MSDDEPKLPTIKVDTGGDLFLVWNPEKPMVVEVLTECECVSNEVEIEMLKAFLRAVVKLTEVENDL